MLEARFQPLPKWTRKPALGYRTAHFKTAYNKTLDAIEHEIRKLNGRDVRIEAGYTFEQIRNDGWPRGGTRPLHPGVVLYFETKDGPLCFPCGTYSRIEDNMHAIALTLEALRAIDRYGVTLAHEQYAGFKQLPAPAQSSDNWTVDSAAAWLSSRVPYSIPKQLLESLELYRQAYREVAATAHPDRTGGSREVWNVLQIVARLLNAHHEARQPAAAKGAQS